MTDNQSPKIWVNGVEGERLSPLDRGFAYGDGLFETCRITNFKIPLWSWHQKRLERDAKRLGIVFNADLLNQQIDNALSCPLGDGVLKVMLSRDAQGRGYYAAREAKATIVLIRYASEKPVAEPCRVRLCDTRLAQNRATAGMKHLSRLEQVIARSEWSDSAIAEGLVFDTAGNLVEATAHNLFAVESGCLVTPSLEDAGVCGVMRQLIIEQLGPDLGIEVRVQKMRLQALLKADEVFLCNSYVGIRPVIELLTSTGEHQSYFAVGRVTERLQKALADYLAH